MGWAVAVGGLVALLAYVSFECVKRLYCDPLSRFPGPKAAALSGWYVAYYMWRGDLHFKVKEWHQRYGETIRLGPKTISINSPIANEQIHGVRANVIKTEGYASFCPRRGYGSSTRIPTNTISAIDKVEHGFKRRIQGQILSQSGLKVIEHRLLQHVDDFVAYLGSNLDAGDLLSYNCAEGWGPRRNMAEVCNYMTYNLVSDLCYNQSLDLFRSSEKRWLPQAVALISRRVVMGILEPDWHRYGLDQAFLAYHSAALLPLETWVRQATLARERQREHAGHKDMFDAMESTADPKTGKFFSKGDIRQECLMILIAGSDTTSTAMASTIFYLLHNQDALSAVTAEVRNLFNHIDEVTPERVLSDCKFVRACIDEAMRLTPSVVHGSVRRVEEGGITVNGEFFAVDTILGSPIYALHRHPDYFESPDDYKPERWMVEGERLQRLRKVFIPFSTGPHSCIGWRLAIMELTTALARSVYLYDMRLTPEAPCCASTPPGSKCQPVIKGWMTTIAEGVVAQFKPRED